MATLLLILKAAGCLLLFLLALLLLLILLLLFVPFRYRLRGSFLSDQADGTAQASWLFQAVSLSVTYHHGRAVSGSLRLFGIPLFRIEGGLS